MKAIYRPTGVCANYITIEINDKDNTISSVSFMGGCPGNALGLASVLKGKNIKEVIELLKGIKCGVKDTSCPDQLARALEEYIEK